MISYFGRYFADKKETSLSVIAKNEKTMQILTNMHEEQIIFVEEAI